MDGYPFIGAEKADGGNVTQTCTLFKVSRSAYYAQRGGTPSPRETVDDDLTARITA